MIKKILTLSLCLACVTFSALAFRGVLQSNDFNGVRLLSFIWLTLDLHYTLNTGINFGLASDGGVTRQWLFAGLALIISVGTIIWIWRNGRLFSLIAGSLFSGGGLANAYERIVFGGVFDYLNFNANFYQNPYSFNLADIYIFVGVFMIIFAPNQKNSD